MRFCERVNENGDVVEAWKVVMDPIPVPYDIAIVLADLEEAKTVNIGLNGKIGHSRDCKIALDEHRLELPAIRLTDRRFIVELEYPTRLFGVAGSVHPKFRVVNPAVTLRTHPHHPHLFVVTPTGDSWACPISAQDTT